MVLPHGSTKKNHPRPQLLLADDHVLVIAGFKKLLEDEFDVVGTVGDGRELIKKTAELRPDAILIEISLPLLNGIEAARQVRTLVPKTKIIFLSAHADPDYVSEAFRVGASGYLSKRSAVSELTTAISEVLQGRTYLTPLVSSEAVHERLGRASAEGSGPIALTGRQREVLQLVAEGKSAKEIAAILNVSLKTVEFHKSAIMQKLGLHSIAELTRYAIEHRISNI